MRRNDTQNIGDIAEAEAMSLLNVRGWSVENLNLIVRNNKLYDLKAHRDSRSILISVKCARAKRQVRLGNPRVFSQLTDQDYMFIFLPQKGMTEIDIISKKYDVWIVPGTARHEALDAHVFYYPTQEIAMAQSTMMIKDKVDRVGGRSKSGSVFRAWEMRFKDAWNQLA